jgi:hypothetical protein
VRESARESERLREKEQRCLSKRIPTHIQNACQGAPHVTVTQAAFTVASLNIDSD